jgi:flagellar hook-associated protein 2
VTLNLLAEDPGNNLKLTVTNDTTTVTSRVQNFVSAYNSLKGVLVSLGGYNSDTQTAGPMIGDALITTIESQLSRGLTNVVSGAGTYNSLASLGITTNKDGTLALDTSKLSTALSTNFNAVGVVFGATDGIAAGLSSFIDGQLSTTGGVALRNKTLSDQQKAITNEQTALNARAQQLTLRYQAQFTAMDTLLSQMQQTSSFLTQQFTNLAKQTSSG